MEIEQSLQYRSAEVFCSITGAIKCKSTAQAKHRQKRCIHPDGYAALAYWQHTPSCVIKPPPRSHES